MFEIEESLRGMFRVLSIGLAVGMIVYVLAVIAHFSWSERAHCRKHPVMASHSVLPQVATIVASHQSTFPRKAA
jgi:hypothetical protein